MASLCTNLITIFSADRSYSNPLCFAISRLLEVGSVLLSDTSPLISSLTSPGAHHWIVLHCIQSPIHYRFICDQESASMAEASPLAVQFVAGKLLVRLREHMRAGLEWIGLLLLQLAECVINMRVSIFVSPYLQ